MSVERPSAPGRNARTLVEYFDVLNSGDQAGWEQAFDDTWHPEAIIHGRTAAELRDQHRGRLGTGRREHVHVIRDIDAYQIEFTSTVDGKYAGPFVATFRDGRIYRVL